MSSVAKDTQNAVQPTAGNKSRRKTARGNSTVEKWLANTFYSGEVSA